MDLSKAVWTDPPSVVSPSVSLSPTAERLFYLWPSRYFHLYMFYDSEAGRTCWLPEGYLR